MTEEAESRPAEYSWQVWGVAASVVVTDPASLDAAVVLARGVIEAVDSACSRFRNDSELALRRAELSSGVTVTPMLATLMESALAAARWTDGAVDPTLGNDLISLGYDMDFDSLCPVPEQQVPEQPMPDQPLLRRVVPRQSVLQRPTVLNAAPARLGRSVRGWERIRLDGCFLKVPADVTVDLGASAKAVAADMAAARIAVELGCGVLVNLGGDIATAGVAPQVLSETDRAGSYWQILVQDTPEDPGQQVQLPAGCALATSSTSKRRWQQAGQARHHILDPRFGLPADSVWRSASVAAPTAQQANAYSTAAIVKGRGATSWLAAAGVIARLVDQHKRVTTTSGWPTPEPGLGQLKQRSGVSSHG